MAGNLLRSPDTCFQVNCHIGLLFGERLDTLFTSSDSKITGFTRPHVIRFVADTFFPLWGADLFFSGFDVEFAGYVWTVAVFGKKKLRIRKYPDTCGRGLSQVLRRKREILRVLFNNLSIVGLPSIFVV